MPLTVEDLSQVRGIVTEIVNNAVAPLATKAELSATRVELSDRIARLETKVDSVKLRKLEPRHQN